MMSGWDCPFGAGYCRSENNRKECQNGEFFYRCADLNSKNYYQKALNKALQYDFDCVQSFGERKKWDFYRDRKKKEDNGEACEGCREKNTEAFECRCQYLRANGKCLQQSAKKTWSEGSKYSILYYQLPVSDRYNGKVDLVLKTKGADELFMTEYKSDRKETPERLLRMICEIVTYCKTVKKGAIEFFGGKRGKWSGEKLVLEEKNIHPAIMFKEGSPQHLEWLERKSEIGFLIEKNDISVFIVKDETIYRLQ